MLPRVAKHFPDALDCYLPALAAIDRVGGTPFVSCDLDTHTLNGRTVEFLSYVADLRRFLPHALHCSHIIEIGGGYGGLAKLLSDVTQPASYTIVDIPQALLLQSKYLGSFLDGNHFVFLDFIMNATQSMGQLRAEYDLCISTNAFTELHHDIRAFYFHHIISRCTSGFIFDTCWDVPVYSLSYCRSHMVELLRRNGRRVLVLEPLLAETMSFDTTEFILWTT